MKKKIYLALITVFMLCLAFSTSAYASLLVDSRIEDNAHLLTSSQKQALSDKLNEISDKHNFDVVIVTVDSVGNKTPENYTIDYYKGKYSENGIILLLAMEKRDYWIQPFGSGLKHFDDNDIMNIIDEVIPDISDGSYYTAFDNFADLCNDRLTFPVMRYILISLVVGIILAIITVSRMKAKLTSVRMQNTANTYTKKDSMAVTNSRDFFLYKNVTRTYVPKNNNRSSSSASSSSHSGSSGGRGGKF